MASRAVAWALLLAILPTLGGCAAAGLTEQPKYRVGILPFPGLLSGLSMPNPDKLGEHRYDGLATPFSAEQDRGLLYTCRAGFIDLAHLRKTADWARHFARQFKAPLSTRADRFILKGEEPSRYHLTFRYPPFWDSLEPTEKDDLIDELSIRLGLRMSRLAGDWHEIISFFGYNAVGFFSEERSAFTYDDMAAHMVGLDVAGRALREPSGRYDEAVTRAVERELARLQVVSAERTYEALDRVKGVWWDGMYAKKRDLQVAIGDEPYHPWLVRDLSFCPGARAVHFVPVGLQDVGGRNFTGFVDIVIEPRISQADKILSLISPRPQYIRPQQHFPIIMAHIRNELVSEFGADIDKPYPQAAVLQ